MATSQNRQSNLQTAESFATHLHTMVILLRNSDGSTAYNKVFETKLPTTYTEASGLFASLHPLTLMQEELHCKVILNLSDSHSEPSIGSVLQCSGNFIDQGNDLGIIYSVLTWFA